MPLAAGTRVGSYEIVAPLGAGGMGEVYRAHDTKLDRDVAIKVLPQHLSADPELLARFEREAKAVAALSHPNILAIHDFGREPSSGVSYAVMELLDGATLRTKLEDGPMAVKKAIHIAAEAATGLAAAHGRNIVHRDLKPENIFLTSDGRVKILDFGLARAMGQLGAAGGTDSPTTLRHTDPGTVLGTVGYMSPEQVKGQPADQRSDIFSLGCVLYELTTGKRAFQRETAAETMTAILREDPQDLTSSGVVAPGGVEAVIRHCLEKQPDERFQSARDLAFALQSLSGATTPSGSSARVETVQDSRRLAPLLAIGGTIIVIAAGAYLAGRFLTSGERTAGSFVFQQVTEEAGVETDPAISPDGASVAFARQVGDSMDVFVQRIGGRKALSIAADPASDETAPAFAPDNASIAFHHGGGVGGIFVVGATGESARRLTDFGFHPAWSPDGSLIAFCTEEITQPTSRSSTSALWVVEAKGGTPRKIFDGDAVQPGWSPAGRRIVFWSVETGQRDLFTIPSEGGQRTPITSDAALDWSPTWGADGYVYFGSERGGSMNVWRIAVDESSGKTQGSPEPVTAGVTAVAQPTVSRDGSRLAFRSAEIATNPIALTFDPATERTGPPRPLLDRTGNLVPTSVSPDGEWLALWNIFERQEDVFVMRRDGSDLRRLTDDEPRDRSPRWSPDGKELVFYSNRTDNYGVWAIRSDGSGLRPITERGAGNTENLLYPVFSPTGDRLVTSRVRAPETIMIDPRRAWKSQKPETLPMTLDDGSWLVPNAWSPDGRRLVGPILNKAGTPTGFGVYTVASQQARRIVDRASDFQGVWWLDNTRVVYSDTDRGSLHLVDADTGRTKPIATGLSLGLGVTVSPDGKTIYTSAQRRQADIWMIEKGQRATGRGQR